jgi:predicted SnoaL-like aldol condensation-catalyzing enzyme
MGVQATSKYVTTGIDIYLLNNGKIKEHWHEIDMERLMMQLFR